VLLASPEETFQAAYSPDGKEVAFIEERTSLRVINLASKEVRTVLPAEYNYSYSDGDLSYSWSPDSKWILAEYLPYDRWNSDIALISADGSEVHNLSQSGYSTYRPKWIMEGAAVMWFSDRHGMRSHGSHGSQSDAYAIFLTEEAYDQFKLNKGEFALQQEMEKEVEGEEKKAGSKETKSLVFDLEGARDRIERLTIHSSALSDGAMTKDGSKLYYLSAFEKGFDLWVHDFKKRETKLLSKLGTGGAALELNKEESSLFVLSGRSIKKVSTAGKVEPVSYTAQMKFDRAGEYAYMFDHVWRQTAKKFYVADMHGVDWAFYGEAYRPFLAHINNGFDFSEMLSEMLGELNGSHTGARFYGRPANGDATAALGIYPDYTHSGPGVKIKAILDKSELRLKGEKARVGELILAINGEPVQNLSHYYELMNQLAGEKILIKLEGVNGKSRQEYVKAMSLGSVNRMLYDQWVKSREAAVAELSGGKIGYVHVRGMDDASFRVVYEKALGKYCDAEALIVDTRFNGGGWLHDDLVTFLSGQVYAEFVPRGQKIGNEPAEKWNKAHCVVVGEGNYSDAHGFPFAYRALGLGSIVGMPVPGTMTAVWWERLIDSDFVFGIPQVGVRDQEGNLQENLQLEPDVMVKNTYQSVAEGKDLQLEAAVKLLMP